MKVSFVLSDTYADVVDLFYVDLSDYTLFCIKTENLYIYPLSI